MQSNVDILNRSVLVSPPSLSSTQQPNLFIPQPKRQRGPTLTKSLATKALLNAHRRANQTDSAMDMIKEMAQNKDGASYVVVEGDKQRTPYAETVSPHWSPRRETAAQNSFKGTAVEDAGPWNTSPKAINRHQNGYLQPTAMVAPAIAQASLSPSKHGHSPITPMQMPEPCLPSDNIPSMPIASIPSSVQQPGVMSMPEPQLPMIETSAGIHMPEPFVSRSSPAVAMPEPSIPIFSPPGLVQEMPVPQIPSTSINHHGLVSTSDRTFVINTPLPPSRAVIPESTYDPSSLQPPEWTDTQTPATTLRQTEEDVLRRVTLTLQHLPPSVRANLGKEEIIRMVLEVIEGEQDRAYHPDLVWPPPGPVWNGSHPYHPDQMDQEAAATYQQPISHWPPVNLTTFLPVTVDVPPPLSANEWFQMNGGGPLPDGWTADYDYRVGQWYYSNLTVSPAITTWHDPRLSPSSLAPMPPLNRAYPPVPSRVDADWLASRFGALEAQRQHQDGVRGPVAAEIDRERQEANELQEAVKTIQRAQDEANQAATRGRVEQFQAAQEAMIKARGKLDRLTYDSQLRNAAIPPVLHNYQGVTRGYDVDPALLRPRTYYTDGRVPFITLPPPPQFINTAMQPGMTTTTSFSGRVMGKFLKPRIPGDVYMPTAYPLPPGVKYKASSTTPTPYAIPEFCFAWDMLLRNRRDPNSHIT